MDCGDYRRDEQCQQLVGHAYHLAGWQRVAVVVAAVVEATNAGESIDARTS